MDVLRYHDTINTTQIIIFTCFSLQGGIGILAIPDELLIPHLAQDVANGVEVLAKLLGNVFGRASLRMGLEQVKDDLPFFGAIFHLVIYLERRAKKPTHDSVFDSYTDE